MKKILLFLTASLFFYGCATSQIGEDEINAQAAQAYSQIKSDPKTKISTNKEWTAIVQRVSQRIAAASGKNYQWEYILIDSPEVNAWCMPGGKMAVYTGIMKVAKTEAALAAVMGHEVAHATLQHGKENYTRAQNENLAGLAVGAAAALGGQLLCKTDQCRQMSQLGGVVGGLGIAFFSRKFSRTDESSADQEGQLYMARAGYDPSESVKLWQRMAAASGGKSGPEFMSTHPSEENRQNNLTSWMAAAQSEYEKAPHKFGLGEAIR